MMHVHISREVRAWLRSLNEDERDRVMGFVDRLAVVGHRARMPISRSLGNGLFELRFSLGPTARRITYKFTPDGGIFLLTTFRKQRNNESVEIRRAREFATTYEQEMS